MDKAYILTVEYNQYDQYGEYFVAWFPAMPTQAQLEAMRFSPELARHIRYGGGRLDAEEQWYNLRLAEEGALYQIDAYDVEARQHIPARGLEPAASPEMTAKLEALKKIKAKYTKALKKARAAFNNCSDIEAGLEDFRLTEADIAAERDEAIATLGLDSSL